MRTRGCPTSPWCHPGAERVTQLSLLTPVSSVALPNLLYFFVNCQPVPGLTAEGAPWDGSGDLADPQQASVWTFCRDEGFTEGQKLSPIIQGLGERKRNQHLLTNCLPPAKECNQVSGFSSQESLLPCSLWLFWELLHPCTSCNLPMALGTWLLPSSRTSQPLQHLQIRPQGHFAPT